MYVAVGMDAESDDLQGCNGRKLLLQFRHFRHPWRSYVAVGMDAESDDLQGCNGRKMLLQF